MTPPLPRSKMGLAARAARFGRWAMERGQNPQQAAEAAYVTAYKAGYRDGRAKGKERATEDRSGSTVQDGNQTGFGGTP